MTDHRPGHEVAEHEIVRPEIPRYKKLCFSRISRLSRLLGISFAPL